LTSCQLLRKAREEKAKRYRAAFKIVGPNTFRPENFLPFASNSAESEHRENDLAGRDPPAGISADDAMAEIQDVLDSIGDTCPECPSED
jgi:hypothetical protein